MIGRLGKDAAIRETQEGRKVISFTLAVNGRVRGTEKTSWYDVASFNYDRYRNMVKYFTKGSSLIVTGDFDADLEEGNDGKYRCRRYVTADAIEFLSNGSGTTRESRTEEEETPRRRTRQVETAPDDISDEELEMTTKPKKKVAPVEDEEDEAPRRAKKRPEPVEDEEDEEPVTKKPKKVAPAEDDEDEAPKRSAKRKPESEPEDEEDGELPF